MRQYAQSEDFKKENPQLFAHGATVAIMPAAPAPAPKKHVPELSKPRGRKQMNQTETRYSLILQAMKDRGEIVDFEREGLTLRWPDGMTYTPDFMVIAWQDVTGNPLHIRILFVEVKGAKIEGDALVKFRAARDKWGGRYGFEMHQWKARTWTKIL